jgi:hypothetical protein
MCSYLVCDIRRNERNHVCALAKLFIIVCLVFIFACLFFVAGMLGAFACLVFVGAAIKAFRRGVDVMKYHFKVHKEGKGLWETSSYPDS